MIFQFNSQDKGGGPTICEGCIGELAACLRRTMVAHAKYRGIQLDGINIDVEGNVGMRGFANIFNDVRPDELQNIGKKFSPPFDTLTNGTSVVIVWRKAVTRMLENIKLRNIASECFNIFKRSIHMRQQELPSNNFGILMPCCSSWGLVRTYTKC